MPDIATLSTLDPYSATKPREQAPVGGRVGFFEDEGTNEGPVRVSPNEVAKFEVIFPSSGTMPFNKVKEVISDAGDATMDLLQTYILGSGPEAASSNNDSIRRVEQPIYGEGISQADAIKQHEDAQKEAQRRKIAVLNTIPLEVYQKLADEALMKDVDRVAGGPITEEDEKMVGLRRERLLTAASIQWLARKRGEVEVVVEERKEEASQNELQTRIYGADLKRTFEDQNMNQPG